MAHKKSFYAVANGRNTGVFMTWEECEMQIRGFSNAKFQKFTTQREAEAFVAGKDPVAVSLETMAVNKGKKRAFSTVYTTTPVPAPTSTISRASVSKPASDEHDVVYCDGACKGNGKLGSVAGIGVWWGHNDARNIAERCPGSQTNNRAELLAIARMLEETPITNRKLLIKTDSRYTINCFNTWITKWRRNGYMDSKKKPIKNKEIICYIAALLAKRNTLGQKISFEYVPGHAGIVGNEGADTQANLGAQCAEIPDEPDWDGKREAVEKSVQEELARKQFKKAKLTASSSPTVPVLSFTIPNSPSESFTVDPSQINLDEYQLAGEDLDDWDDFSH